MLSLLLAIAGVLIFGAMVGATELITRYRDDPMRAVWSLPAIVYVGVNSAASLLAFGLIRCFDWKFGINSATPGSIMLSQALVAAFGSAALFRSSLFSIAVGDQTIGIGPSSILGVLTAAADRAVDRQRAIVRCEHVTRIMKDTKFEDLASSVPALAWGAMQNASTQDISAIEKTISALKGRDDLPDSTKSSLLGFALLGIVGDQVLEKIVSETRR